jgi:Tol biopolymer transport system component
MDADGSNVVRIGSTLGVQGVEVVIWSPDESKVAFVQCPEGPSSDSELLVVNADGSGEVNVSNNTSPDVLVCGTDGDIGGIDWSPDGNRLVFYSLRDPRGLYIVNADGSGLTFLVSSLLPTWSPDGQWIAFIGQQDEANWQIDLEIIRPDGSGRMLLAQIPCSYSALGGPCMAPRVRWSPDGTMLLFSASPSPPDPGFPAEVVYDVYSLRSDGSGLTNLTRSVTRNYASRWVDCSRPTAGCEARVTNIGPEGLNLRTGTGLGASTVGKLSEGDVVCFIGPPSLTGGFKWWPLHAADGTEGWAAAFDPSAVDEPWLTPTGDPCQGEPAG